MAFVEIGGRCTDRFDSTSSGLPGRVRACSSFPTVVLTGVEDDRLGLSALQEGTQDCLVKGEIPGSLLTRSVRYAVERSQALAASARRQTGVGVLFLDLDNFKTVNDTLGHTAGDHVLCVIARRLTVTLRE